MLKSTFAKVFISFLLGAATAIFFFWETRFSLPVLFWHWKFERELNDKGSVKLADLVNFKFEKVYFLEPYDYLTAAQEDELFPAESWLDLFWWEYRNQYWTIAYKRPGKPPFLIKMSAYEWHLRRYKNFISSDPDVRLRAVQPDTIESTYCTWRRSRCVAVDDEKNRIWDAERNVFTEPYAPK